MNVLNADFTTDDGILVDRVDDIGRIFTLRVRHETSSLIQNLYDSVDGDMVWGTTWLNADTAVGPLIGLTGLTHALPDFYREQIREDIPLVLHPKTPWVRLWAHLNGIKKLVWIDDDLNDENEYYLTKPMIDPPPRFQERVAEERCTGSWLTDRDWRAIPFHTNGLETVRIVHVNPLVGITEQTVNQAVQFRNDIL